MYRRIIGVSDFFSLSKLIYIYIYIYTSKNCWNCLSAELEHTALNFFSKSQIFIITLSVMFNHNIIHEDCVLRKDLLDMCSLAGCGHRDGLLCGLPSGLSAGKTGLGGQKRHGAEIRGPLQVHEGSQCFLEFLVIRTCFISLQFLW